MSRPAAPLTSPRPQAIVEKVAHASVTLEAALPLRIVAYPAPDLPGIVISHALDLDLLAQGATPDESAAALFESIGEMIAFRLSQDLPPMEWNPAPEEVWQVAESVVGVKLDRTPPELHFQIAGFSAGENAPQPMVIVADRAPALAHAC